MYIIRSATAPDTIVAAVRRKQAGRRTCPEGNTAHEIAEKTLICITDCM
jgi:hypothetical protein